MNIDQHLAEILELRHHLHSIAEVSGEEYQTADCIEQYLKKTAADEITAGIGGNGILARFDGAKDRPQTLLRCELDALPIKDKTEGIAYKSRTEGVGHKCGHDGHMAIMCGVAKALSENTLGAGTIFLLFQPDEETGNGAEKILQDPKFTDINPDFCFALHNLPGFPKHEIVVREGVFASASVGLTAELNGSTTHAASPEQGNSPALAVSQLINALSAAPQFRIPIEEAAKVTVVHSSLGERAFGTSPGEAIIMATLRTHKEEQLEKLKEHCQKLVKNIANTYNLNYKCKFAERFSPTVNDPEATKMVRTAAGVAGLDLNEKEVPFGWSEDFGHFTKKYKGSLFGLGAGVDHPSLHAESYDFPDDIISTGVKMFLNIIKSVNDN